jgi:sugar lactone lactonase YvrE
MNKPVRTPHLFFRNSSSPVTLTVFASLCLAAAADFDIRDEVEFKKIVPPDAHLEKRVTDMKFTEGPVWVAQGRGYLIFSDIPADELKKWTVKEGLVWFLMTFRQPSQNANGNTLDRQGRLITCEHSGRRLSIQEKDGTLRTLVDQYNGKKFNSPNDVVVKSDGTVWFTDPPYGLPKGATKEQDGNYVFRFEPKTKTTTIVMPQ